MKKENGITLIVLIITIILMLILVGIVLQLALGENGLISISKQAKEGYKISTITERLELIKSNMYSENEGLGNIDKYLICLNKEKLEPYKVTKEEKVLEDTAIVEVDNKYVYIVKINDNSEISYIDKIEEDPNIEIEISGEIVQTTLPIKLNLKININKDGKYIINKEEKEIGKQEILYTEEIKNEQKIEIGQLGNYYIHILTSNKYGQKEEIIKPIAKVSEEKHTHTGSNIAGGGCYTNPIYSSSHTHTTACVYWMEANIGQTIICPIGHYVGVGWGANRKTYYCGTCYSNKNWICGKSTEQTIQGYSLGCGKSEADIMYKIEY